MSHTRRTTWALLVFVAISATGLVNAHCPNFCNGHGICSSSDTVSEFCECFESYTGPDCGQRKCPTAKKWVGFPVGPNDVHSEEVECANMGKCDTKTGVCLCEPGFGGLACEKMVCPGNCNGHGQCLDLETFGRYYDGERFVNQVEYDVNWDHDMIRGCVCERGYTGYDCSQRLCPFGDDVMTTGDVDETQVVACACDGCSGSFFITFRGATTAAISVDAVATRADEDPTVTTTGIGRGESIEAKLEGLRTIDEVEVIYSNGGAACTDGITNEISIRFLTEHGDLPSITVTSQLSGNAGTGLTVYTDGDGSSVQGTKENLECGGRGLCDRKTGLCTCFYGFGPSDGQGNAGTRGDCGHEQIAISNCPNMSPCSGHGTCSGAPEYTCTCENGWLPPNCQLRTCPMGNAWFDEPVDSTTAHALAECSNKGLCNRATGECKCQAGFTGAACDRLICPGASRKSYCYERGRCMSLREMAKYNRQNGEYFGNKEVQEIDCDATSGTIDLNFNGALVNVDYDATASELEDALETLATLQFVTVTYSTGSTFCAAGSVARVTFDYDLGDLNLMQTTHSDVSISELVKGTRYGYGTDPGDPATWDADMLFGCLCDSYPSYNHTFPAERGPDLGRWTGHDCGFRPCPFGPDPNMEPGSFEEQTVACTQSSGTFQLKFREEITAAIDVSATAAEVQAALEALPSIGVVEVSYDGTTTACHASGTFTVTFLTEIDDLPLLIGVPGGGFDTTEITVSEAQKGTILAYQCSNRGRCDPLLGECKCFSGYVSGDLQGNKGARGDCGAKESLYKDPYEVKTPKY